MHRFFLTFFCYTREKNENYQITWLIRVFIVFLLFLICYFLSFFCCSLKLNSSLISHAKHYKIYRTKRNRVKLTSYEKLLFMNSKYHFKWYLLMSIRSNSIAYIDQPHPPIHEFPWLVHCNLVIEWPIQKEMINKKRKIVRNTNKATSRKKR